MNTIKKLPNTWMLIPLMDYAHWVKTGVAEYEGEKRYFSTSSIKNGTLQDEEGKYTFENRPSRANRIIQTADLLQARMSNTNKALYCTTDISGELVSTGFLQIRSFINNSSLNKYLFYYLNSDYFISQKEKYATGSTQVALTDTGAKKIEIAIAPESEQSRIVEKLDELFSELDAGVKELKTAKIKLTQYRQSLLKNAIEGLLTKQWRETNNNKTDETGAQLLERILIERRKQWQQKKLEEFKAKDKKPTKGWESKYPEPEQLNTTDLPDLPESWVWASVMMTGNVQLGRQRAPKFHNGDNMVPYLRVANVFEDRIDTSDVMSMHFSKYDEETYLLKNGDILLNEGQSLELIGRPAIYRNELDRACFTNTLVRYQASNNVLSEYAILVFKHYMYSGRFQKIAKITTNLAHLGAGRFAELEFPVPPMSEQIEIIELFSTLSDKLEKQLLDCNFALKQLEAQRKNIFKLAFSGQLVPQNPNDEPASVLLEKIKKEKEALAKIAKPRIPNQSKKKVNVMDSLLKVLTAEDKWLDAQEAFEKCGIIDGSSTDRIEGIYTELRKLEKEGKIEVKRNGSYDQLKLIKPNIKQEVKED